MRVGAREKRPVTTIKDPGTAEDQSLEKVRAEAEREHIISVLQLTEGNRVQAARVLGISRKTLWKKLKHLGVSWPPNATDR
jgi:DNA-binding NtrC family response regulator